MSWMNVLALRSLPLTSRNSLPMDSSAAIVGSFSVYANNRLLRMLLQWDMVLRRSQPLLLTQVPIP